MSDHERNSEEEKHQKEQELMKNQFESKKDMLLDNEHQSEEEEQEKLKKDIQEAEAGKKIEEKESESMKQNNLLQQKEIEFERKHNEHYSEDEVDHNRNEDYSKDQSNEDYSKDQSNEDYSEDQSNEDYSEDEEYDDQYQGEEQGRKRIKRKKRTSKFIDDEAGEADDYSDEEDEDYEAGYKEHLKDIKEREELPERRAKAPDFLAPDLSLEDAAKKIDERYGGIPIARDSGLQIDHEGEEKHAPILEGQVFQESLLPSVSDSNLWLVRCKVGAERNIVINLMLKYTRNELNDGDTTLIKSAFFNDTANGFFYVEADRQLYVSQALQNIPKVYRNKIDLVPIKEMVAALRVQKIITDIQPNDWVRVRHGLYGGDLGLVIISLDQGSQLMVKLVPRIDFIHKSNTDKSKKRKGRLLRPSQRLFSKIEARDFGTIDRRHDAMTGLTFDVYNGNKFHNGFIYKIMRTKGLITKESDVSPTIDEIEMFNSRLPDEENIDNDDIIDSNLTHIQSLSSTNKNQTPREISKTFKKGMSVMVKSGDLKNLTGVVVNTGTETITVLPNHKDLINPIEFDVRDLSKFYKIGDHIKVIRGPHKDTTGMVVQVDEQRQILVIFSDLSNKEIKVLPQNCIETTHVSTSARENLGSFELHDLVMLHSEQVACIVKIEGSQLHMMNSFGEIFPVSFQDIKRPFSCPYAVALDNSRNQITKGDIVRCIEGNHKDIIATIKYIYRTNLFLHSQSVIENSGIFVVKSIRVKALGGSGPITEIRDRNRANVGKPFGQRGKDINPNRNVPFSRSSDHPLKSKVIKITRGTYKGLNGTVKDVSSDRVTVELHSKLKTVTVNISVCKTQEEINELQSSTNYTARATPAATPFVGSSTPFVGSQTPFVGSQTPYS